MIPGSQYAMRIIHPGSPVVRERYPHGILVDPYGFPRWLPHARATVALPDPLPGHTLEEMRVLDVLAANEAMTVDGDPLWEFTAEDYVRRTPPGWTWAHAGRERRVHLVPVELHASYRHLGGVSTMRVDRTRRGLRADQDPRPTGLRAVGTVPPEVMTEFEGALGRSLPPRFRSFFAGTNGGAPLHVGVLPGFGFVLDQALFGLGGDDPHQDPIGANNWLGDRLTDDLLAIGWVQGGLLAVCLTGPDADSIWYCDDDDFRDDASYDAVYLREHLLHRVADDIDALWGALLNPPRPLLDRVDDLVGSGAVRPERPDGAGAGLPDDRRAPWQSYQPRDLSDPLLRLADVDLARRDPIP